MSNDPEALKEAMRPKRLPAINRALSPRVAGLLIAGAVALVGVGEWKAISAKESRDYPRQTLDMAYCTKCHPGSFVVERMKLKEGRCSFLFRNGKPADLSGIAPPGSALNHRRIARHKKR